MAPCQAGLPPLVTENYQYLASTLQTSLTAHQFCRQPGQSKGKDQAMLSDARSAPGGR